MNQLSNNKGFTLIEIIAVIIILAVVFAFVIPRFINSDKNAVRVTDTYEQKAEDRYRGILQYMGEDPDQTQDVGG